MTTANEGGGSWRTSRLIGQVVVMFGSAAGGLLVSGGSPLDAQGMYTVNSGMTMKPPAQMISIDVRDVSVLQAIQVIARQAKLRVTYGDSSAALSNRVTVQLRDTKVQSALNQVLQGTDLIAGITPEGDAIFVRRRSSAATTKDSIGVLNIVVIDSAKQTPVTGAFVKVQGTRAAGTTNDNGVLILRGIPLGTQSVEVKILGYKTAHHSVVVADDKPISLRIVLSASAALLSGVVTTATGEQRRAEVGHSMVSINMDSLRSVAPITSVTDVLESRVPGMTLQRTSGTPGDPARIRLRGTGSIYENNDPLIVVDGVRMYSEQSASRNVNQSGGGGGGVEPRNYATPSPLDQIDPSMIEKIEVLKGPSASALYGSDAGNGVIVITTKRGQAGPPRWAANLDLGTSHQPGSWPTSTYQWVTPFTGGMPALCIGFCGDAQVDSVKRFQALNDPYLSVLGSGSVFRASANVSGGTQTITYNLNANLGRERGLLKLPQIEEDRFRKFHERPVPGWMRRPELLETRGAQGQFRIQFSPSFNVTATTLLNQSVQRRTSMSASGNHAIQELQKKWIDLSQLNEQPILGNPYERVTTNILNLRNSVQLAARPVSWLPISGTFGMNTQTNNGELKIDRGMLTTTYESGGVLRATSRSTSEITATLLSQLELHERMRTSAGLNFNRGLTNDQRGGLFGIPLGVTDPSAGEDQTRVEFRRSSSERVSFGWFVEPRMILSQRFFVTPGFRLDNNGLSGRNAKFNGLPKMNLSWLLSDEGFFPWKDQMQMLRLRTAFGVSGVQPTPDELNRLYASQTINPFGGQEPLYGSMLQLSTLGNTRLRPERVSEVEGGIDLAFWDNRVQLDVTHFRKFRKDAIVSNEVAGSIDGGTKLKMNVGDFQNTGTEIALSASVVERRNLSISVNTNFSRLQSLVRRLNACGEFSCGNQISMQTSNRSLRPGYPLSAVWMRPILGYADLNDDGWISQSETVIGPNSVFVGAQEPEYQLGVHPSINILGGRVNVSASFSYVSGQLQTSDVNQLSDVYFGNLFPQVGNIEMGPDGFDRQVALQAGYRSSGYTFIGYSQKVNMTRWQSLSARVTLSPTIARLLKARQASVALRGQNLGLWTNYIGVDPNVNSVLSGHGLQDSGQQPEPRIWMLSLSLGY